MRKLVELFEVLISVTVGDVATVTAGGGGGFATTRRMTAFVH